MMDLWTLFVENVFGGFWIAVIALGLVLLIILAFGSISGLTILEFLGLYFFAMALGYGYPIFTVMLFAFVLYYFISSLIGWTERSGGN